MFKYDKFIRLGDFSPVKEGDELEVDIENIGEKGDGIARIRGFIIFIPGTSRGDKVKIRVTKILKRVGFGELLEKVSEESKK